MSEPIKESGLFASSRRLLATAFEMAQVRLALLGTEVEFEKRRLFDGLLWGAVAVLALGIGLVLLCGFVILLFWEGYRLAAVGVLALLLLVGSVLSMREARQRLRSPTGMFNASVAELERDRAGLQASGQHEQR
jgi:uncharacterized membrane protein YqjE